MLSGSSLALEINSDTTYTENINLSESELFNNSGTINNDYIIVNGGVFTNNGTINTKTLEIFTATTPSPLFDGIINSEKFIFKGAKDISFGDSFILTGDVRTKELHIIDVLKEHPSINKQTGLTVNEQKIFDGISDKILIESYGQRTGLRIGQRNEDPDNIKKQFVINTPVELATYSGTQDARVEIFNGNNVNFSEIHSLQGKTLVQLNNTSTAVIDNVVIDEGATLNIGTTLDITANDYNQELTLASDYSGQMTLSNITVGQGSSIRVNINNWQNGGTVQTQPSLSVMGDINVNLGADGVFDFGGYNDKDNHDWRPEDIIFNANSLTVNVAKVNSSSMIYLPGTKDESGNYKNLLTKVENIKLIAAANNNTGDAKADLTALANIIKTNTKETVNGVERVNTPRCLPGVQLEQKPTDIFDGSTAIIADSRDCENCTIKDVKIEKIQTEENPNINGIAEMAALGLHVWRNEIDDMHKRVGELRDSNGEANGMWARVNNGQARYGDQDVKNNFTSVQVGYDRQIAPGVWLGGALSYTDGENDFRYGDGETDLYSFSLYNSWLFDNGIYLDLVGKFGRMKNSFDIQYDSVDSSGDYHTNAVSLSAEMGWRYYATESLFVEPQLEMWYGHVFDADYRTSTGIDVDNEDVNSLVGRAGLKLGFDFPDELGSFFVKASVLHDWEGDADYTFRKGDIERSLTESLGGTWYEYGFGADFNPMDNLHLYADVEAGNGGEVDTDYRFNLGARYAW